MLPRFLLLSLAAFVSVNTLQAQNTSPYWSLAGNSNASNTTSKLGTTNAVNLRLYTKNLERMRIDTSGRVGIGTTAPGSLLEVRSTASGQLARFNGGASQLYIGLYENSTQRGYIGSFAGNNQDVDFGTNVSNATGAVHLAIKAAPKLTVNSNGDVGIGTTAPTRKLTVQDGDLRLQQSIAAPRYLEFVKTGAPIDWRFEHGNSGRYLYLSFSTDDFFNLSDRLYFDTTQADYGYSFIHFGKAKGYAWDVFSDAKLKTNVKPVESALSLVGRLAPKTYTYKHDAYPYLNLPSQKQYGLIAQELEQVLPELVTTSATPVRVVNGERINEDIKAVNYIGLVPVLIKAVQEQQQQIEELKNLVAKLAQDRNTPTANTPGRLEPAAPNPVAGNTRIGYWVPAGASAFLVLTDAKGQAVKTITLNGRGAAQVTLNTAALASGTYNYTLYVNGQPADTKRLVVAR